MNLFREETPDQSEPPRSEPTRQNDDQQVLSAGEAAAFLRVSKWALYDACNCMDGPPHRRLGRRILFSRQALLLWLDHTRATLNVPGRTR